MLSCPEGVFPSPRVGATKKELGSSFMSEEAGCERAGVILFVAKGGVRTRLIGISAGMQLGKSGQKVDVLLVYDHCRNWVV